MKPSASCSVRLTYHVFLCLIFCLWLPTIVLAIEGEEEAEAEHAEQVQVAAGVHLPAEDAEGREKDKIVAAEREQEVQLVINCIYVK